MKIHYALIVFLVLILASIPLANAQVDTASLRTLSIADVEPDSMTPGESTDLKINIENDGDYDADNVIVSWVEPTNTILSMGTGNIKNIGKLAKNEDDTAEFSITTSPSADPGLYQLAITMVYNVNDTEVVQEASAGVKIGGDTNFEVIVTDVKYGQVTLSISNVGKNPAESITVQIPKQEGYEPIGTAAMTLGKLAKNDYVTLPFEIKVLDSGKDLDVEISYTDTDGNRKTWTAHLALEDYQLNEIMGKNLPEKSYSGTIISILIIVGIIVGIIYFYRKRKKKRQV